MEIEIVPTILSKDPEEVEKRIKALEGKVERFQFDCLDGVFLPQRTVGLEVLRQIETPLQIDVHLMTNRPEEWVERVEEVMADRVIGQVEKMGSQEEFINSVVEAGLGVGLALSPETPVSVIEENLPNLDVVLVMTRQPGFGKFSFDKKNLEKVRKIRELSGEYIDICVDGGVTAQNIKKCAKAGANLFAIGGAIWRAPDIEVEIERLKKLIGAHD